MKEKKIKIHNYNNFYNYYHSNHLILLENDKAYKIKIVDYGIITRFERMNRNHFIINFFDVDGEEKEWILFRVPMTNKKMIQELNIAEMEIRIIGDYDMYHRIKKVVE